MNMTSAADARSQAVRSRVLESTRRRVRIVSRRSREEEDMAIQLKHRLPSGETRPWTLKEIIQGRPFDRVTHPMFVHFPIAGYTGALALDVMSKLWTFPSAPLAASWLIIGAFAGT